MESIKQAVQAVIDYARRGSLEAFITAVAVIVLMAAATAVFADGDRITFHDRNPDAVWGQCENAPAEIDGQTYTEVTCYVEEPACYGKDEFGARIEAAGGRIVVAQPMVQGNGVVFVTVVGHPPVDKMSDGSDLMRSIDIYFFNEQAQVMCHAASVELLPGSLT